MPRQNRVDPTGTLIATAARGTLMGNRGCLHNHRQQIVRPFQTRRWIACRLEFKGRRRPIMAPGQYTELFFLDEVTALAAGHRPCAECRRADYNAFRQALARGNPGVFAGERMPAEEIDRLLHAERLRPDRSRRTVRQPAGRLPDGVFIRLDGRSEPRLIWGGWVWRWGPAGCDSPEPGPEPETEVELLTPPLIAGALRAGYRGRAVPFVQPAASVILAAGVARPG